MRGTHRAESYIGLALVAIVLAVILGWCMNVVAVFQTMGGALDAMFVARVAGIFAFPLGVILGYF
mgnify:CR=1 FL=1